MGVEAVVWAAVIVIFLVIVGVSRYQTRGGRRSIRVGPAASGTIYDFLNQDKRNAIELIVEEKAGARDPETADDIVKPPDAHY